MPDARLIVAGGDHPQAPGYIESMKRQHAGNARIEFRGYIPESDLADLFQSSSLAVMPYTSSTGCSGVAHLACAFGVPIVSADLPDFRQMAQSEELAIDFYPPGNALGLADCLLRLLNDIEKQGAMATQNFSAALRMTMPNVVQKYLRHFELQQRVQTLRHISRFRRLPSWVPSKSLMLRLMTRNSLSWARRSVILHSPWSDISPGMLLNGNGNGRGKLRTPGSAVDRDDITAYRDRATGGNGSISAARYGANNHAGQNAGSQGPSQTTAVKLADENKSR
jgi:Glycosyl transferases group 1